MATKTQSSSESLPFSISKNNNEKLNKAITDKDDFDCVKVEICELDNSCQHPTTVSLMQCKKQILHPFRTLLCLIGWRPFGLDSVKYSSILIRILNIIYPLLIFTLLLFNYIYEIIVCQGQLSIDEKAVDPTTTNTTTSTRSSTLTIINISSPTPARDIHSKNDTTCRHIFTTYVVPDILHCAAFIIGLVYFRITEGEAMYSLMEKVFIHADQTMRLCSPTRVIRRLKIFLLIGCIWVCASVTTHTLPVVMMNFHYRGIFESKNGSDRTSMQYGLFILDIICLFIKNCIHFAVAMYFVSHCEMVVFYCKAIRTRLEEKSIPLLEAMKQILDLKSSISQLNSAVSRMMSILIVYFLDRIILGIILLTVNEIKDPLTRTYRILYPIVWISILTFCLGQAARVTSKCDKFYRITQSMRVYGYHTATSSELDGFLLFILAAELRVKLFGITVRPGKMISLILMIVIVFVVLFQTNIIKSRNFSL